MASNYLYVYSNATYREKGWRKVGQSITPESRISSSKTSSPEELEVEKILPLKPDLSDHDIHDELKRQGFPPLKMGGGREWFEVSLDDVMRAYHKLTKGHARAKEYTLRTEQKNAVIKASNWFNKKYSNKTLKDVSHPDRFLLNAKMRFGKCFTSIHIAKEINAKNTLIVTYKPEVLTEWMEAVNDHLDFIGWTGIRAKKSKYPHEKYISDSGKIPKVVGPSVICVSLQDLWIDDEYKTKKRLKNILNRKWDLVIFDEVHYGSMTSRAKGIIDKIKGTKRLDLSGTPFRLLEMEDFCKEQVYTYSYLDEQKNKKNEGKSKVPIYGIFPDIDFSTIEITEDDLQGQLDLYRNDDLELSLNKLFEASGGNFKHTQAVDHFLDGLVIKNKKASSISVFGALASRLDLPAQRHSVWWVNSVNTANAFAKKLKSHIYFRNFEIINAAGCGKDKLNDPDSEMVIARDKSHVEATIKKSIRNRNSSGTITITVKRFLTGVTIKEWDSILILNDNESPEEYYQAIFRIQSPWQDESSRKVIKPKSWVFDFSTTRCLMMKIPLADAIASEKAREKHSDEASNDCLKETTEELCSAFSLKSYVEGRLTADKITAQEVFAAINIGVARASLARRITSDALIDCIPLCELENDPSILKILESIKGYRTQDIGAISPLVKIGKLEKRKHEQQQGSGNHKRHVSDLDKKQKQMKDKVVTQIKRLAIAMADFIYMTQEREHCIGQVIETKEKTFFKVVTGITKDDFKKLCKLGFIKKEKLNSIVRDFYHQEVASLKSEEFVLNQIKQKNIKLKKKRL